MYVVDCRQSLAPFLPMFYLNSDPAQHYGIRRIPVIELPVVSQESIARGRTISDKVRARIFVMASNSMAMYEAVNKMGVKELRAFIKEWKITTSKSTRYRQKCCQPWS